MNPQMQARLSVLLAAVCGLSGLLVLLFWLGVGRGYSFLPADDSTVHKLPSVATIKQQSFSMPGFASFAEISQRPLFSEDRKPIAPGQDSADKKPQVQPVPLQVSLTGIIITPELKLAMLKDKTSNKDVSLRVGMPLPGNQSSWMLVEIHPRKVVFRDNDDKTSAVELTVSKISGSPARRASGAAPARLRPAQHNGNRGKEEQSLRERIEQRRKQLREQAQKMRAQQMQAGRQQDKTQ